MTRSLKSRLREINQRPARPIQVMGDSVSAAISTAILTEELNDPRLSVANYSLPGTPPSFAPLALERQCRAGRRPRFIIYAPHIAVLGNPQIERFVGRFGTASEIMQLHSAGAG